MPSSPEMATPVSSGELAANSLVRRHGSRRLPHERSVQLLAVLCGMPGTLIALLILWFGDYAPKVQWTLSSLIFVCGFLCVSALRRRIVFPLQTLTNLLAAMREGDYSLRARQARRSDVLGEVLCEINTLGETLLTQRRASHEATALLQAVMTQIEVAIFTFDQAGRLQLINASGCSLLGQGAETLKGSPAERLGLADCLKDCDGSTRTTALDFPGRAGSRWGVRCTSFRQDGRSHRLLVLADLSQPLREEERVAWQRLIRVLGHELNNSLAPIQSIAGSLVSLLSRPEAQRADDWQEDLDSGLGVIASRAESLGRFMASYAKLARLPAPQRAPQGLTELVRRVASLETRLEVNVETGPEMVAEIDAAQIEQVLINLIRNAVDASRETRGGVTISWRAAATSATTVEILVDDEGLGIANSANLFVPFFTTKPEGSGIGLALSRQIAEAHGGTLTLNNHESAPGCRATLRLPLRWAAGADGRD